MTLQKTELLCQSDYDRIFKIHVYTLVWLKSDRIGFLTVELKHPDYWLIVTLLIKDIRFCVLCRREISFPGPWAESRRTAATASFLRNIRKKELHCASSLCNYHVHHIWNVQRCSFISLFVHHLSWMPMQFVVAADVKRYSATYWTGVWHAPADNPIFSPACILGQLQLSDWAAESNYGCNRTKMCM